MSDVVLDKGWLYDYQTLVTGLLAVLVGFVTMGFLWWQIHGEHRRELKEAASLGTMLWEDILLVVHVISTGKLEILKFIVDKDLIGFRRFEFPERGVLISQLSRITILDPEIATSIVRMHQSMIFFEKLQKQGDNEILWADVIEALEICTERAVRSLDLLKDTVCNTERLLLRHESALNEAQEFIALIRTKVAKIDESQIV